MVVEGARLTALANGEPPPLPHEDPDIRAEVAAVTADFTLAPGSAGTDLTVILATTDMAQAGDVASQIATRLAPRLRRGIEIRTSLSRTSAADSPAPCPFTRRPRRGLGVFSGAMAPLSTPDDSTAFRSPPAPGIGCPFG
jgi:hypothetical protein